MVKRLSFPNTVDTTLAHLKHSIDVPGAAAVWDTFNIQADLEAQSGNTAIMHTAVVVADR